MDVRQDRVDELLAQWHRERPDLPTQAMGIFGRFGRLLTLMEVQISAPFVRHGLQSGEFDVLATLRRSGQPFELKPSELAEELMISRPAMTGRLDRLESAGLVRRISDSTDRRSLRVQLTPSGRGLMEELIAEHADNEERLLEVLSSTHRDELDQILRILLASVEE
ncbi:MarR family winged helix-turn-helix transcriptional regulator [Nocardia sp. NPDC020380]|uniref:MarR family winged helix-turn-helix transcriptional regulator n=1 Tax=Nocardia sp. NPDC020380 TaxID=3364309 RepID=UPI003789BB19